MVHQRNRYESTLVTDSSVRLMNYDLNDLGSLILIQIHDPETLKELALNLDN